MHAAYGPTEEERGKRHGGRRIPFPPVFFVDAVLCLCCQRGLSDLTCDLPFFSLCVLSLYHHTHTHTVALANGELRVYHKDSTTLLDMLQLESEPSLLRFGRYGREDNTLLIVYKNGSLSIKVRYGR